jgi:hypothetical protein
MRPAAALVARRHLAAAAVVLACFTSACSSPGGVAFTSTPAGALHATIAPDPPWRADGSIPRDARWVVALDGYVDPDSVFYGALTLRSGKGSFDFAWAIDFVDRRIVVTPRSLLLPGAEYTLVAQGLVALDGRVLEETAVATARAGDDVVGPPPAAVAPTWNGEIGAILGLCAATCHARVGVGGVAREPARALDLTGDPRDPVWGVIGVRSVATAGTTRALLRVAPGQPAESVLLRKLIGGNPRADSRDEPYPNVGVDGRRMPIPANDDAPGLPAMDIESLRKIQAWIVAGAPIE